MGMTPVSKIGFNILQVGLLASFTYFAGSRRFIRYFPNSNSTGLFLSGIVGGGCAALEETLTSKHQAYYQMNMRRIGDFFIGSAILAPLFSKVFGEKLSLSLKDS